VPVEAKRPQSSDVSSTEGKKPLLLFHLILFLLLPDVHLSLLF
jgi:hypothetical protein